MVYSDDLKDQAYSEHQKSADAKRVLLVFSDGEIVSIANPLPVTGITSVGKNTTNQYGTTGNIPKNIETDIVNLVVPVGKILYFEAYTSGGTADGFFQLKINAATMNSMRNSAAMRSVVVSIWKDTPIKVTAGGSVRLTVSHTHNNSQSFEGNILGYYVDE